MKQICTFVSLVTLTVAVCASCQGHTEQKSQAAVTVNAPTVEPSGEKRVEFDGVSFSYDSKVFGDVENEIVPVYPLEEPDYKPDRVAPKHLHFMFALGRPDRNAHLSVYPLDEFPKVYSVNPEFVKAMERQIEALKRVLKDPTHRYRNEIPHLPFEDVSHSFYVRVRHFNFVNGRGVLFVTHWAHGYEFVSNRNLIYRFEGIVNDGRHYVTAETPLAVTFLPAESPVEVEGLTWKELVNADENAEAGRRQQIYIKTITDRLEKLGPSEFQPHLEKFESIIRSLKIAK
jgi:hypothetical protein